MQAARIALLREWVASGQTAWLHVTGHSMQPFLPLGARIEIADVAADDLRPGALIVYEIEDRLVCHRVLACESRGRTVAFTARGDAWRAVVSRVPDRDVVGVVVAIDRRERIVQLETRARRVQAATLAVISLLVARVVAVGRWLKRSYVGASGCAATA